jgi:hypothetical protein
VLCIDKLCLPVLRIPFGTIFANDSCSKVTATSTYTCNVSLFASPYNTLPTKWDAGMNTSATGHATSIIFAPSSGTLALNASVQITITVVDSQCPDTIVITFYDPETPGLPHDNNRLTWIC